MCWRPVDLRLRAWRRSVFLLHSRIALSLAARSLLPSAPSSSSSVCFSLVGGCGDAGFCVPLASSISGPPRFPFPRPAILPDGRGGDGVVLPACFSHLVC